LPGEHLGRDLARHRHHPGGRLYAVALWAHHLRQAGEARSDELPRSEPARGGAVRAARHPGPVDGGLSHLLHRDHGARRRQDAGELSHRACTWGLTASGKPCEPGNPPGGSPMNWTLATPELVLALGTMALLMIGVYQRRDRLRLVAWLSVALL